MRMKLVQEQQEFLDKRLAELALVQPQILELRDILLNIGGCHVVAPSRPEPDLSDLISHGGLIQGDILFDEMARNSCHWNVAEVWKSDSSPVIAIGTGYALSEDGLWRQHTWGITASGIFETTEIRHTYYGIRLDRDQAAMFASRHSNDQ